MFARKPDGTWRICYGARILSPGGLAGILSPPNAAAPQSFAFVTQSVTPGARVSTQSRPSGWPTGTVLVGQAVLYRPDYGWVSGTVARRSRAAGFSHVVRYSRASALGSVEAPSLLDAASHGPGGPAGRWVLRVLRHTTH